MVFSVLLCTSRSNLDWCIQIWFEFDRVFYWWWISHLKSQPPTRGTKQKMKCKCFVAFVEVCKKPSTAGAYEHQIQIYKQLKSTLMVSLACCNFILYLFSFLSLKCPGLAILFSSALICCEKWPLMYKLGVNKLKIGKTS